MTEEAPIFFESPGQLRVWLAANHETTGELWIGFWRKATGRASVSWPQVVDEALCVGWIDGIVKSIDAESFKRRLTPRRPRSIWSQINLQRFGELRGAGRVLPAGVRAFETRDPKRMNLYSYEQASVAFAPEQEAQLRADAAAWAFWQARPPSYRRAATWWVVGAKQAATRQRRLIRLVEDCANGRTVGPLTPPGKKNAGE